ncbi:MAG: ABC transporter ATP-binding protein [Chitinophagales bacterium]|nr:ABC transporter ATP-binding protein [Chitinophagaceae bacterium]MCB9064503.1 ABC transporter ATP-binding protein [Chitinophagales bacterium]
MAVSNKGPLSRILQILKFERKEISSIYFYAILTGLVQLTLPIGIQSIISFVLGGSISTSLVLLIILVVIGVFVNGLLQVNQMKIIEKIQQQLFVRYSFIYAQKIPKLDLKSVRNYYLPELVNRFFDVISLQKGISKLLLDVPTATIQIIFGLLLLSFYHPAFIFFGILLVVILYMILRLTGNRGLETSLEESSNKYKVAAHLEEVARMSSSFKFINDAFQLRKADKHITGYLNARTSHFRILLVQYWTLIGFKILITAAMLVVGAVLLVNQQLNIGQFIAAEIVIILVINSVEKLIVNLDKVYDVITSLEKINTVIDSPEEESGEAVTKSDGKGMDVKLVNLSFSYDGKNNVLNDLSFEVESGTKLFITGSAGSGKSTLLQLVGGLFRPDSGQLLLDKTPVNKHKLSELRRRISVIFSHTDIYSGTLMDNITMGKDVSYDRVNEMAELVGLKDFVDSRDEGYDMMLHPLGEHLPDGVAQKILLMRVMIAEPGLMLLEDPFDGVEEKYVVKINEYICKHMSHTTVLLASNDRTYADKYDALLELEKGSLKHYSNKK